MSERYNIPTEPRPESFRACDDCVLTGTDSEYYFSPQHYLSMNMSQVTLPKDQRRGIRVTAVGLSSRRDINLPSNDETDETTLYENVILPVSCDSLRHIEVLPEDWSAILKEVCKGPETGRRRFLVIGNRKKTCRLLNLIKEHSLPN